MAENPMKYKNFLNLITTYKVGKERRAELLTNILEKGAPLPQPVIYEDIDKEFKKWVEEELKISYEGKEIPTMTLYSSQRFSEYSQTWHYTDNDQNILMNFKTISRENNPQEGSNQGGLWNIPGERFYLMSRQRVLDDNGTESFLDYKMKQPFCVDLRYTVSIFTNKYQLINEFNTIVNDAFKAHQCYIHPNMHYMPMLLEGIDDESEYNIDDRQFFAQTYEIKVMAYIITEDDFKIEEVPSRTAIVFDDGKRKRKANAEIEESETEEVGVDENGERFYYKPLTIIIDFPTCVDVCKFSIDTDMKITGITCDNVMRNTKFFLNEEEMNGRRFIMKKDDDVKIKISRYFIEKPSKLTIHGYDPNVVYDSEKDLPEVEMDFTQPEEVMEATANIVENNK